MFSLALSGISFVSTFYAHWLKLLIRSSNYCLSENFTVAVQHFHHLCSHIVNWPLQEPCLFYYFEDFWLQITKQASPRFLNDIWIQNVYWKLDLITLCFHILSLATWWFHCVCVLLVQLVCFKCFITESLDELCFSVKDVFAESCLNHHI